MDHLRKGETWKKIAKRLARAIVRYDKNDFGYVTVSESAILLAHRIQKTK